MTTGIRKKVSNFFSETEINTLARKSGFVKRKSSLTGYSFLLLSMFDHWEHNRTSLNGLCINLKDYGVNICKQSLHTRFNASSVNFLKLVAEKLLVLKLTPLTSSIKGLGFFKRILILDSTSFQLPEHYSSSYKGTGGDGSLSAIKIQLCYNLKATGEVDFDVQAGSASDKSTKLMYRNIEAGDLRIEDLGYFKFDHLKEINDKGAFYLFRLAAHVKIYQRNNGIVTELNIEQVLLEMKEGEIREYNVVIGIKDQLPTRLVLEKLPLHIIAQKMKRYRINQFNQKKKVLAKNLLFRTVNAYITNVPASELPKETVRKIYALRWQIEIIFKTWKSFYHINKIKTTKLERFQSFIYGKLILMLLHMKIYQVFKSWIWNNKRIELSEIKAFQTLIAHVHHLKNMLLEHQKNLDNFFDVLSDLFLRLCRKERRQQKEIPIDVVHRYFP